ncbi:MAG: acetylglutamate kinase [Vicinamibacteria bacterium]|nr:acetylglutamate kinase [Vicinamibacteria bacterium]
MSNVRVYKVGGPALEDPELIGPLAEEVRSAPGRVLLVHGGGRSIERMLKRLAIESRFIDGRRETSPAAMEVVEMILSGVANKALAAGLTRAGVCAVGVSGRDAGLITARLEPQLDRVGVPDIIDTRVVAALWDAGLIPVVSPVSSGPNGEAVNVNADEVALGLARAVQAESLVYLSDVDGVRIGGQAVLSLDESQIAASIADGTIAGGMALKVRVALDAVRAGIAEVVIAGKARLLREFPGTRVSLAAAR